MSALSVYVMCISYPIFSFNVLPLGLESRCKHDIIMCLFYVYVTIGCCLVLSFFNVICLFDFIGVFVFVLLRTFCLFCQCVPYYAHLLYMFQSCFLHVVCLDVFHCSCLSLLSLFSIICNMQQSFSIHLNTFFLLLLAYLIFFVLLFIVIACFDSIIW